MTGISTPPPQYACMPITKRNNEEAEFLHKGSPANTI